MWVVLPISLAENSSKRERKKQWHSQVTDDARAQHGRTAFLKTRGLLREAQIQLEEYGGSPKMFLTLLLRLGHRSAFTVTSLGYTCA